LAADFSQEFWGWLGIFCGPKRLRLLALCSLCLRSVGSVDWSLVKTARRSHRGCVAGDVPGKHHRLLYGFSLRTSWSSN